jgi:hypothetical protein
MASELSRGFAIYPMVEEHEATGRVAAVYGQILRSMPFVPSLFKSLATCPAYLVLAWDQASHALADPRFGEAAASLSAAARDLVEAPPDERVRRILARFVDPLGRMLLTSVGLLLALEGRLVGQAASPVPADPEPVEAKAGVPSQWEVDASATYGAIRRDLDTPIVNSIWRALAAEGVLEVAWSALGRQAPTSRPHADRLQDEAVERARSLPWAVVADPDALAAADVEDTIPAQAAILDAYVKTLPRVLALAGSSAR